MSDEIIYQIWAPDHGLWSLWVKPVLFTCMEPSGAGLEEPVPEWNASSLPEAAENVALVLDLPGAEGVQAGIALARRGYRPVPLYNAVPMPAGHVLPVATNLFGQEQSTRAYELVDVRPIMAAISTHTRELQMMGLADNAPPAFLLDSGRKGRNSVWPGSFDNRSVSFPSDFPSANFLKAQGITRVILVQYFATQPQSDLAQTLYQWQQAGLPIGLMRVDQPGFPEPCGIKKLGWFLKMWQRLTVVFSMRRSNFGGFGDWVPEPGSGG